MATTKIPLSLYIHIPWCIRKCPYCDFNSHQIKTPLNETEYIDCLINDLKIDIAFFKEKRELQSIFIGGGTPSIFSGKAIADLITKIKDIIQFANNIEITIEANPGTTDSNNFKQYYNAGINRISIGVQSFDNNQLQKLGRIHNEDDIERTIEIANDVGFNNINIDLMFGLINQTPMEAANDIDKAIKFGTNHISYYQLTIEPQTFFAKEPPQTPNQDTLDKITDRVFPVLENAGFSQYEVSAWGKNSTSKHNLNYWQYGDYLGIGAGAHSKISTKDKQIIRTIKHKNPRDYINNNSYLQSSRIVKDYEKPFEFMLNTLRLKSGFNINLIQERGFFELKSIDEKLKELREKELLITKANIIKPTTKGYLFLNNILQEFL